MKALTCVRPGVLEYIEKPMPEMKKGHALIKIKSIGICGTDLHAYTGVQPFFDYPRILGHELSGEILEIDGADDLRPYEAVTFLPYIPCGHCNTCKKGKTNCCSSLKVCGVHIDGGMSDYFSIPSHLVVPAQGLDYSELAMVEPMAIGTHGVRRADIHPEEYVLVMGAGPIGIATILFAKMRGANLIVLETNQTRIEFCRSTLGLSNIIDGGENNIREQLAEITKGEMPSIVLDATGNRTAINEGFNYLAHGGKYILIGLQKENIVFSHPEFHKRELTLMSSRNATREDFDDVIESIRLRRINPGLLISKRVAFENVAVEFPDWTNPSGNLIKVMIEKD